MKLCALIGTQRKTIEELITILSMRFLSLKTFKEVCEELEKLQRLPGETIVLFVGRLERLAYEYQRLAPGGGSDAVRVELVYNHFIRKVCDSRTAQRLEELNLDGSRMPLVIKAAQDFVNRHEIEPWCRQSVEKENAALAAKNTKDTKPNGKNVPVRGKANNVGKTGAKCYNCGRSGHLSYDCNMEQVNHKECSLCMKYLSHLVLLSLRCWLKHTS